MNEKIIKIDTEYIKLQALLKLANVASSGAQAKHIIVSGVVKINGQAIYERGKKIKPGMLVECEFDGFHKIRVL